MSTKRYIAIQDIHTLRNYIKNLSSDTAVSFDTETTGLRYLSDTLLGISIFDGNFPSAFVYVDTFAFDGIPLPQLVEELSPYITQEKYRWIAHNAKFDLGVFKANGFPDPALYADSMLAVHINNPDDMKKLEKVVKQYYKHSKATYEEIIGKKWGKIDWVEDQKPYLNKKTGEMMPPRITVDNLAEYACEDTIWTHRVGIDFIRKLKKEDLDKILFKIETPLCYVLRDMEYRGVTIDRPYLEKLDKDLDRAIKELLSDIYAETGYEFNVNSSQQLAKVLYDHLNMPVYKTTPTGNRSTDKQTLEELEMMGYEVATMLNRYSALTKLSSGFAKSILKRIDDDGRLRCNFNSEGARTGRMSSSNPNFQNQPNNEEFNIRGAFIPTAGHKFVIADWSQIELRMIAHCSRDPKLIEAFSSGADIHQFTADHLNVTRKQAKTINFGIVYGMGPAKLAHAINVSVEEAKYILHGYYATYQGYMRWKTWIENKVSSDGYVKNIFGRVRRLPAAKGGRNNAAYFQAMRQAVNTIIQGSSADLMKLTMLDLDERIKKSGIPAHSLMVVHDEFVSEVPDAYAEEYYHMLVDCMENRFQLRVPIVADGKICERWSDMKDDNYISLHLRKGGNSMDTVSLLTNGII